ncbi:G-patch domain-containing protein [Babesia ovata]|uniref:G-patch domain-containing protein n=1 Tax=Babesia ovata TaxID=189622 RepID=A0A2H6KBQ4_9APIC|nr:G-patch domain-containing protein [Babesia ovata]GBE60417.1 G-patch domain-containing protein [Babesia ovata]
MSKAFRESVRNSIPNNNSAIKSKFGAAILAKYGWKEGEGLGKNRDGIVDPVKLKAAKNNEGLGKKDSDQWHNWWDDLYNEMASKSTKVTSASSKITETERKSNTHEQKIVNAGDSESLTDPSSSELSSDDETSSDISSESNSSDESNRSEESQNAHSTTLDIHCRNTVSQVQHGGDHGGRGDYALNGKEGRSDADNECIVEEGGGVVDNYATLSQSGTRSRSRTSLGSCRRSRTPGDVSSECYSELPSALSNESATATLGAARRDSEIAERRPQYTCLPAEADKNNAADSTSVVEKQKSNGGIKDERHRSHRHKRQKQS